MTHRLGIIGGGNMGAAIVRGIISANLMKADELIIAEIDSGKRQALIELGCAATEDIVSAVKAEQIMLAVKPQVFPQVAQVIAGQVGERVVISIMAGLGSRAIRRALGGRARVIRVMPNTPSQIGAGMAAIALGEGARPGDEKLTTAIFNALGRTTMVDEPLMYAVTAVSGSGPAYVFLLAEAMEQAAASLGIDPATARLLASQTVMGAGRLLSESDQSAADLRKAVTSPGGTTAAALDVFNRHDFTNIVIEALTAARDRGTQLDQDTAG